MQKEKISGKRVSYSVTTTQSVEKLVEALQIDGVDLVFASNFMSYLRPGVFHDVIDDTVSALYPGGAFYAMGYAGIYGSRLSIDDGYKEDDKAVHLMPSYGREISLNGEKKYIEEMLRDRKSHREDIETYVSTFLHGLEESAICSEKELAIITAQVKKRFTILKKSPLRRLRDVGIPSIEIVARKKMIRDEKEKVLKEFGARNDCQVIYTKNAFMLEKAA